LQGLNYYHPLGFFAWLEAVFTSNPSILSGSTDLYLGDSFRHVPRLRGTICEPLYLGNVLLFLWPLLLVPLWKRRTRLLVALSFFLLLMWTWSRGAWLACGGQLLVGGMMTLQAGRISRPRLKTLVSEKFRLWLIGLVLLLAVLPLAGWACGWEGLLYPYRRLAQTFSSQDWSNLTRLYSMQAAWRAFLLSPICGIGWGQFGWHFPALVDPMGLQSQFTWPVVNNFLLLILCETGLLGMLVWSAWVIGLVRAVRRRWAGLAVGPEKEVFSPGSPRLLLATSLSAFGVWIQMLTFSQYNLPHIWVAVGLLLASLADGYAPDQALGRSAQENPEV
jgi:O-antigen ligase